MADHSPRPLLNVAVGDESLGRILRKAQHLKALEAHLKRLLPAALAGQVRVADLRGGVLVLGAPSPAAASRLRYAGPDILKALAADFSSAVRRIEVRVVSPPGPPPAARPRERPQRPSAAALERAAATVSDPDLRRTLERMAERARLGSKEEG